MVNGAKDSPEKKEFPKLVRFSNGMILLVRAVTGSDSIVVAQGNSAYEVGHMGSWSGYNEATVFAGSVTLSNE